MSSKINLQTCEYARKSSIFQDNQLISIENIQHIAEALNIEPYLLLMDPQNLSE